MGSWNFNANFGGAGYTSEATRVLLDHLFNVKDAPQLYARVEDDNLTSQSLYERLGMRREGLFPEFVSSSMTIRERRSTRTRYNSLSCARSGQLYGSRHGRCCRGTSGNAASTGRVRR